MRCVPLLLLITVLCLSATYAQTPSSPAEPVPARLSDYVVADYWAYADMGWLLEQRTPPKRMFPQTYSTRGWTRGDFAQQIVLEVRGLNGLDDELERAVAGNPKLRSVMTQLLHEFAPEIRTFGIDPAAVMRRINAPPPPSLSPFADIPSSHDEKRWRPVIKLLEAGIFIGYPDGTLRIGK
jgi:hypothetical protein